MDFKRYLKFLIPLMVIMFLDIRTTSRFRFLWPYYLLMRSTYNSFKNQGTCFALFYLNSVLGIGFLLCKLMSLVYLLLLACIFIWMEYLWYIEKKFAAWTIFLQLMLIRIEMEISFFTVYEPLAIMANSVAYPLVTLFFSMASYDNMRENGGEQIHFYMQEIPEIYHGKLETLCNIGSYFLNLFQPIFVKFTKKPDKIVLNPQPIDDTFFEHKINKIKLKRTLTGENEGRIRQEELEQKTDIYNNSKNPFLNLNYYDEAMNPFKQDEECQQS